MAENVFNRIPPHNLEAEQSVLGCMLIDDDSIATVTQILKEEDFYAENHRLIFGVIKGLFDTATKVDFITVQDALTKNGILEKCGDIDYLITLSQCVTSVTNVAKHAEIVLEKSMMRALIKATSSILEKGYEATDEAAQVMEYAEQQIIDVLSKRERSGFVGIKQVLVDTLKEIEHANRNRGSINGVPSGFKEIDKMFSGFQKSDLILIAARPAMGKTAFVLNIAQYAAVIGKVPTAIFSLEMSKEQLVKRMIASQTHLDSKKLRDGEIEPDDWHKINNAVGAMAQSKLFIDDTSGINVTQIRAKCRKLKQTNDLGLIVIDYLQLMESSSRNENRQQQISEISRSLKILAKELNVPVLCLSQLSRGPEQRTDKRPMLSDLRESGAIEQDADIVMFIYRDDYYNEDSEDKNIAEIIVAKNRHGDVRTVKLAWLGQYTKFVDLDRRND